MVRSVLFSVALSAILIYAVLRVQSVYESRMAVERVTAIHIYADRITYRTNQYATMSLLANGLKAVNDPPRMVALHDCARMNDFEAVLDLIRGQGYSDFEIELPEHC